MRRSPAPTTAARGVGVVTLAAGLALALAPERVGPLFFLHRPREARIVGLSDLALVPGLLGRGRRWPWMAARASFNPPLAALLLARAGEADRPRGARALAAVMLGLTVANLTVARGLRDLER